MSAADPNPWIGRCLGDRDRYRVDRHLGGGGMGDVYVATDRVMFSRLTALKLLKTNLAGNPDLHKRFRREVEISAALNSPYIVQVYDWGATAEGFPFYAMEYLRGESLGQVLRREKRLSVERTVRIIQQVCAGLGVAHAGVRLERDDGREELIRVVHRDLKPDNLFLLSDSANLVVKILDFGIAKIQFEHLTQTNLTSGVFLGSARYASPEQWDGNEQIDGRADIYSLGIILYEMLTGTDPFGLSGDRSANLTSWLAAHAFARPRSMLTLAADLPPELDAVVMRCLEKNPQERFATVQELSQALRQAAQIGPLTAPPSAMDANTIAASSSRSKTITDAGHTPAPHSPATPTLATPQPGDAPPTSVLAPPPRPPRLAVAGWILGSAVLLGTWLGLGAWQDPLQRGQELAQAGDLEAAIRLIEERIGPNDSRYAASRDRTSGWRRQQASALIAQQKFGDAQKLLAGIPASWSEANPEAKGILSDLTALQSAQAQISEGRVPQALAAATRITAGGEVAKAAEPQLCQSLTRPLNQQLGSQIRGAMRGLSPLPDFNNYRLANCLSSQPVLRADIVSLKNRSDDNLKVIAITMAGLLWQDYLPKEIQTRLEKGRIRVELWEENQAVAAVVLSQPALLNQQSNQLNQLLDSTQLDRRP